VSVQKKNVEIVHAEEAVFLELMPCCSCKNRRFEGTYHLRRQLVVTANVVPSSLIIFTLMMEAIRSSEKSTLTRAIWRHIPEDGILLTFISLLHFHKS
jgi:hypothetical protein